MYTYNNAGQRLTEASNALIRYTYDQRGLLTRTSYDDNTYEAYTYDAAGRCIGDLASASNISSAYTYDSRNRLTTLTRTIDSTPYPLTLGYDPSGNVTSILYPGDATPLTRCGTTQ